MGVELSGGAVGHMSGSNVQIVIKSYYVQKCLPGLFEGLDQRAFVPGSTKLTDQDCFRLPAGNQF